jgi:hypothetical protein
VKQIAARWIRRSKLRAPHGHQAANSIGGSKNGKSGWAGCAVKTDVRNGSKLPSFVQQKKADSPQRSQDYRLGVASLPIVATAEAPRGVMLREAPCRASIRGG